MHRPLIRRDASSPVVTAIIASAACMLVSPPASASSCHSFHERERVRLQTAYQEYLKAHDMNRALLALNTQTATRVARDELDVDPVTTAKEIMTSIQDTKPVETRADIESSYLESYRLGIKRSGACDRRDLEMFDSEKSYTSAIRRVSQACAAKAPFAVIPNADEAAYRDAVVSGILEKAQKSLSEITRDKSVPGRGESQSLAIYNQSRKRSEHTVEFDFDGTNLIVRQLWKVRHSRGWFKLWEGTSDVLMISTLDLTSGALREEAGEARPPDFRTWLMRTTEHATNVIDECLAE